MSDTASGRVPVDRAAHRRRGRPRKHHTAYGQAANESGISVRNLINWDYARQGAAALNMQVTEIGLRPVASGPPELAAVSGTTVLTEFGRCLEALGRPRTVELAYRVARVAESAGLDANATAKLVRRLRTAPDGLQLIEPHRPVRAETETGLSARRAG
jgi:hypothetical protein